MTATIFKFPYDASRRPHSRKPRRSKNGTPEERAAALAATTQPPADVIEIDPREIEEPRRGLYAEAERKMISEVQLRELQRLVSQIDRRRMGTVLSILREAAKQGGK
jgi:hypothetical protein